MTRKEQMRQRKIRKDEKELKKYEERLRKEKVVYHQNFDLVALNQRRSREAALGACVMKALDAVRELSMKKQLVPGSLYYNISENKVNDPEGRKGFLESVTYFVMSYEKAHTEEQIAEEIRVTREKMMMETDELFPAEEEKQDEKETCEADAGRSAV